MARKTNRKQDWKRPNINRRLLLSVALMGVTAVSLPGAISLPVRFGLSWDIGVILFLVLTLVLVRTCSPREVQQTVLANDENRVSILILVLISACASLSATFFLLQGSNELDSLTLAMHVSLSVLTSACSWALAHVIFAFHYAHCFYRDDPDTPSTDATGGLKFPGDEPPDYWDFLYFSFVIGMTSQVSDVQVSSKGMRRVVLWHGLFSFAFYTVVLALSINIVGGLVK